MMHMLVLPNVTEITAVSKEEIVECPLILHSHNPI